MDLVHGYEFAVDMAIATAHDDNARRWYEGMAAGLQIWAGAVSSERWKEDQNRIFAAHAAATAHLD